MNQELLDLAVERGRLIERISMQRQLLGQQLQPLSSALQSADRAVSAVRNGADYVRQHPELVAATVLVLVVLKPSRMWRWTQRGLFAWRTWRLLRGELFAFGLSSRP